MVFVVIKQDVIINKGTNRSIGAPGEADLASPCDNNLHIDY